MSKRLDPGRVSRNSRRATLPSLVAETEALQVFIPELRNQPVRDRALLFVLTGRQQGAVFPVQSQELTLGRDANMAVHLDDDAVSGEHARIVRGSDGLFLEDRGSTNGTFLNERRLQGACRLVDGDHVRFGNTILRFSMVDALEEKALTNLFELTVRDPLTRAYNRRFLTSHLRSELAYAGRQGISVALLLADIDHFKVINDSYGHARGDLVLQLVANAILRLLRPYDALCRYGGEEFVVVARDTSLNEAEVLAERVRHQIESLRFDVEGQAAALTVSVGVSATRPAPGGDETEALLLAVDEALYAAKEGGRNCVRSRNPPAPSERAPVRPGHTAPPLPPPGPEPQLEDLKAPALPRFG